MDTSRPIVFSDVEKAEIMRSSWTHFVYLETVEIQFGHYYCSDQIENREYYQKFDLRCQFILHFVSHLKNLQNINFVGHVTNIAKIVEFAPNI